MNGNMGMGGDKLQIAKDRLRSVLQNSGQDNSVDFTDDTDALRDELGSEVDEDIVGMLENLKNYDKLNEGLISGMANISDYRRKVVEADETDAEDADVDSMDEVETTETEGKPDPEIMEWIARFNKLGR